MRGWNVFPKALVGEEDKNKTKQSKTKKQQKPEAYYIHSGD